MGIADFPQAQPDSPLGSAVNEWDGAARFLSVRAVTTGQGRLRRRYALGFAHPGQLAPPLVLAGYRAAPPVCRPTAAQRAESGEPK